MARASSVILTPAEKKLAVNNAKEAAKLAKPRMQVCTKTALRWTRPMLPI